MTLILHEGQLLFANPGLAEVLAGGRQTFNSPGLTHRRTSSLLTFALPRATVTARSGPLRQ